MYWTKGWDNTTIIGNLQRLNAPETSFLGEHHLTRGPHPLIIFTTGTFLFKHLPVHLGPAQEISLIPPNVMPHIDFNLTHFPSVRMPPLLPEGHRTDHQCPTGDSFLLSRDLFNQGVYKPHRKSSFCRRENRLRGRHRKIFSTRHLRGFGEDLDTFNRLSKENKHRFGAQSPQL